MSLCRMKWVSTDDMRVSREEIFGPIIPMQPFKTLDEAIKKANNTIYGLSSYFFGHNAKEIAKAFEGRSEERR